MNKTIYLAGIKNHESFGHWGPIKARLENNGYHVHVPFFVSENWSAKLEITDPSIEHQIRITELLKCGTIITTENWFEHAAGKIEVEVGRILSKRIIHFSKINELCSQ